MRRRNRMCFLLGFALFVVQATGLHLHAHLAADGGLAPDLVSIHVAIAADHAGDQQSHHDEGVELSLPDSGLLKKASQTDDLAPALAAHSWEVCFLVRHTPSTFGAGAERIQQKAAFSQPLLRAPPAPLPV